MGFYDLSFVRGCVEQSYLGVEEALEIARKKGISHVYLDLTLVENKLETWTPHRVSNVKNYLEQYGISVIVHGSDTLPIAHKVEKIRRAAIEVVKEEMAFTSLFETKLVIHGGQMQASRNIQSAKILATDLLVESLSELLEHAASVGVELWMENQANFKDSHPFYNVFCTLQDYEAVLSKLPNMNMILDVGHMNVNEGDYISTVLQHSKNIKALSLSDNDGTHDSHAKIGLGTLQWKPFLQTLISTNWKGLMVFETPMAGIEENQSVLMSLCENMNIFQENSEVIMN